MKFVNVARIVAVAIYAITNRQSAMGNGQSAIGNRQWAMGNRQWAMGNSQLPIYRLWSVDSSSLFPHWSLIGPSDSDGTLREHRGTKEGPMTGFRGKIK